MKVMNFMAGFSDRDRVVFIGRDVGEAACDWLWLTEGGERQELGLFAFVHMCFPLSGGIVSLVVVP